MSKVALTAIQAATFCFLLGAALRTSSSKDTRDFGLGMMAMALPCLLAAIIGLIV